MYDICSSWRHLVYRYTIVTINCWRPSPACDVCEKFGSTFPVYTRRTAQGNDFKFILTVKMEPRHPVKGYFVSFVWSVFCNYCGVMAAWNRKTWKFCEQFLSFLEKRSLTVKFSKLFSESFHRLTDRRCCVQISWNVADGKSAKSCLLDQKNFDCLSNCRYCTDHAQNLPGPAPNNVLTVPDFIQIRSLSAEL